MLNRFIAYLVVVLMAVTVGCSPQFMAGMMKGAAAGTRGYMEAKSATQRKNNANKIYALLEGALIIADDGKATFLGKISGRYGGDSIFNEYGRYGSKYSSTSIWNQYSLYGSKYSTYSAFSKYTSSPPFIVKNDVVIGRLTVNALIWGAVNPYLLKALYSQ